MSYQRQRGVAMIVVLLIVAMVAIIATNITGRNQLSMRRTLNQVQYDQAYWYALSAEELAKKVLKQDLDDSEGKVHLQQYWALADVVLPVEKGEIAGKITDMRSCFNLNALARGSSDLENGQPKMTLAARQFKALLVALGMDEFGAERLTHTLKDYLDEDTVTSPFGAEDAEYESRNVPYRAANTLMSHRSELRAVMGFTQDVYLKLAPYVCAIPGEERQLLNINTLEVERAALLAAMLDNSISVGEAESVINQRPGDGFDNVDEFWELVSSNTAKSDDKLKSSIVLDSKYFHLEAGAKVNEAVFRLDSVLRRAGNNQMDILTRQYGGQK
ncbi:type II secretion system minor pseudopilin GspK [Shewanella cyperi]|uniref:type II secretion system minor pseudopilin GspK n=1 Tax=Shewanella cyperi TaxID=2814292 RepID=UPI001A93E445|nr:type II secretion system minor pseudopilin GspK [Shewanella cyperi]QSX41022.1 type II secretion system minor pseudopilin GspK [Shewanella cyperi]